MSDNSRAPFQVAAHQSEGTDRTYLGARLLWHSLMFTSLFSDCPNIPHTHLLFYFWSLTAHTPWNALKKKCVFCYPYFFLEGGAALKVFWHGLRLWDDPKTKRCSFHIGLFPRGYFVGERPLISSYCQMAPFLAKKRKSFTLLAIWASLLSLILVLYAASLPLSYSLFLLFPFSPLLPLPSFI